MKGSRQFRAFFDFIADKFGDTAFSRSRDGVAFGRLAPAYFEAVVGALAGNLNPIKDKSAEELQANLSAAFETPEFKEVSGPGANSKAKMESRIEIVRQALLDA